MLVRVGSGACAVLLAWLAVWLIRAGIREWRNTGDEPLSHRMRFMEMMDDEALAGRDRGAIVMGLCFGFLGAGLAVVALAGNDLGQRSSLRVMWGLITALGLVGFMVCVVLYMTILHFNRPKFLVPPRHRRHPGQPARLQGHRRRPPRGEGDARPER